MGVFSIKYKSADASDSCTLASNGAVIANCTRTLIVRDTYSPVITLIGGLTYTIEGGSTFNDPGASAIDVVDGVMNYIASPPCSQFPNGSFVGNPGSICRFATINGLALNTLVVGNQTMYYVAKDLSGNLGFVQRTITVIDTTPPIITIFGPSVVYQEAATLYIDQGAQSIDIVDGNMTSTMVNIIPVNVLPPSTPANFTVKYTGADKSHNWAIPQYRTVIVRDTTKPTMTLLGSFNMSVEGGTFFIDPFVTAFDTNDGDITDQVSVTITRLSNRNCNATRGCSGDNSVMDSHAPSSTTFLFTYSVSDKAFNTMSITRNVKIIDTTPPQLILIGPAVYSQEG